MQATITEGFLESIPLSIRQRLNLQPGIIMDFDEETPYLKAVLASPPGLSEVAGFDTWLADSIGIAKGKITTDERMMETRGDMMSCIGVARGKGSLGEMSSAEWLELTRGPVELPPEA